MKNSNLFLMSIVIFFLAVACGASAQSPTSAPNSVEPTTVPTLVEIPTAISHIDVLGIWNAGEFQRESTNTANVIFDRKKFEFTENAVILDDLFVIEYKWLDANRQTWKDTPAAAGWGGLNINLLISVRRDGDNLTITIKDGYIKLQR